MKCPGEIGARQAVKPESRVTPRSDAWRFLLWVMYCKQNLRKKENKRRKSALVLMKFELIMLVDFLDIDRGEVTQIVAINQDDMDDVIIANARVNDVSFADEHLDDVIALNLFCKGVKARYRFFEVRGGTNLRQENDGDVEFLR